MSRRWRLTPEIVIECRRRYAEGESKRGLVREFGVAAATMRHAIIGLKWAHVTEHAEKSDE